MSDRERKAPAGSNDGERERARNISRGVSPSMQSALKAIERASESSRLAVLRIQTYQQQTALNRAALAAGRGLVKVDPKPPV